MKTSFTSTETIVLTTCAVLAGAFLFYHLQKKQSGKPGKKNGSRIPSPAPGKATSGNKPNVDRSRADISEFKKVFADKLEAFRKDMLAYQLERLVWKNQLSAETIEKIRAEYGKVLLQPSFYIFKELNQHHLEEADLNALEQEWLQKRGYPVPADKLKETIEQRIFEEEHKKALEIVAGIMPEGKSVIDYC